MGHSAAELISLGNTLLNYACSSTDSIERKIAGICFKQEKEYQ